MGMTPFLTVLVGFFILVPAQGEAASAEVWTPERLAAFFDWAKVGPGAAVPVPPASVASDSSTVPASGSQGAGAVPSGQRLHLADPDGGDKGSPSPVNIQIQGKVTPIDGAFVRTVAQIKAE